VGPVAGGTVIDKAVLGGTAIDTGKIAIDSKGNRYVTGSYRGTAVFGNLAPISSTADDAFLLKLDATNKPLWVKSFGGKGRDAGDDVALDVDGSVFMSGSFDSPEIQIGRQSFKNHGVHDVFLAKLDPDGQVLWANTYGDVADQMDMRLTPFPGGGVVASGWFSGAMSFAGPPTRSPWDRAFFVARIDSDGHGRWGKAFGHRLDYLETDAAVDAHGNILVSGGSDASPDLTPGGSPSMKDDLGPVLVKLDPDGKLLSARRFGRDADNLTTGIAIDPKGNIRYAVGTRGVTTFDGEPRKPQNGELLIAASFDPAGALLWRREIIAGTILSIAEATGNAAGDFFIAGQLEEDDPNLGTTREAGYVVKLDAAGRIDWTLRVADGTMSWLSGLALDPTGRLVAVGAVAGADSSSPDNRLWIGTIAP